MSKRVHGWNVLEFSAACSRTAILLIQTVQKARLIQTAMFMRCVLNVSYIWNRAPAKGAFIADESYLATYLEKRKRWIKIVVKLR